jgi:hypothetical protein
MNRRIAAGFLAIFATGLTVAPVETAARGGGFVGGGRAMPVVRGFRGPIARPAIAPVRPAAAAPSLRATPFAHARFAPVPFGRGNLRHRRFFSNGVAVWGDAPWYSDYTDPASYYGSYPAAASPADDVPVQERVIYVMPPRPGCTTQTYRVPADSGGKRSINVVRC